MICEKLVGTLDTLDVSGKTVEYIDLEWYDAFKKIYRAVTDTGREIGVRMDDFVLTRGLHEGDVIYMDSDLVIAVHTPPCEVIRATVQADHPFMVPKVCYKIGNRHAPLFYGKNEREFITPYNAPMLEMLQKLHGVETAKELLQLDFDRRISASIHNHQH